MSLPKINRSRFAERWGDGASMKRLAGEFGLTRRQVDYLRRALHLPARAMYGKRIIDSRAHAAAKTARALPTSPTPLEPIRFITEPTLAQRMGPR